MTKPTPRSIAPPTNWRSCWRTIAISPSTGPSATSISRRAGRTARRARRRPAQGGFWKGQRRREELVTQALVAMHCYVAMSSISSPRTEGPDHRRVHRPRHGGSIVAARAAPGDRGEGRRAGHRRQGKPRATELPAILPPISDHGRHDRNGVGIVAASCGRFISGRSCAFRPTSRASASICRRACSTRWTRSGRRSCSA